MNHEGQRENVFIQEIQKILPGLFRKSHPDPSFSGFCNYSRNWNDAVIYLGTCVLAITEIGSLSL